MPNFQRVTFYSDHYFIYFHLNCCNYFQSVSLFFFCVHYLYLCFSFFHNVRVFLSYLMTSGSKYLMCHQNESFFHELILLILVTTLSEYCKTSKLDLRVSKPDLYKRSGVPQPNALSSTQVLKLIKDVTFNYLSNFLSEVY